MEDVECSAFAFQAFAAAHNLPSVVLLYLEEESLHFAAVLASLLVHDGVENVLRWDALICKSFAVADQPNEHVWYAVLWLLQCVHKVKALFVLSILRALAQAKHTV